MPTTLYPAPRPIAARLAALLSICALALAAPLGLQAVPQTEPTSQPSSDSSPAPQVEANGDEPRKESSPEALFQFALAKLLMEERSYAAAETAFEKAVELDPDDPYLRIEYIHFLQESDRPVRNRAARQRQVARIVEQAEKARELAPDNLDVLRAVGQVYMRRADQDPEAARLAMEAFTRVREAEPWDAQTMVSLGQLYFGRGRFAEAAEIFAEAVRYVPDNRILYNFLADAHERAGQESEAAAALEHILTLDPGDLGTRLRLVELLGRLGEDAKALEVAESAPTSVAADERLRFLRARALFRTERPEEALELIDGLDRDRLSRRLRLYYTDLRARVLASLGRGDEALDELTRLLDLDPGNPELLRRVTGQLTQDGRRGEARSLLETFLAEHGSEVEDDSDVARAVQTARLALAAFHVEDEAWDEAVAVLEPLLEASEQDTRLTGAVNLAEVLFQAGRTRKALSLLDKGDAGAPAVVAKRVELLLRGDDVARAQRVLRSHLDAEDPELTLAAVQAFHVDERWDDTLPVLEELAAKHPDSLQTHFLLGAARERIGAAEEAATAFERALEIDPDHAQTLNYLGYMWADRGENLERALELVERAVSLDPHNGAYVDSLGWAHYRLGHLDEAREKLERAVHLAPGDPVVYEHLGDVYAALGENGKAAELYRRALQVAAEDGDPDQDLAAVQRKLDELKVD